MLLAPSWMTHDEIRSIRDPKKPISPGLASVLSRLTAEKYGVIDYKVMLGILLRVDEPSLRAYVHQTEMAKQLGISPSAVSHSIRKFINAGFLSKQEGSLEMRWYNYLIHPEGAPKSNVCDLSAVREKRGMA